LRIAPLVLRWCVAAVLIQNGLQRAMPAATDPGVQAVVADAEGVSMSADWGNLVGVAELGVGGLLAVGFLTRAIALAVIAVMTYGGLVHYSEVGIAPAALVEQLSQVSPGAMMLLAAAGASLLVSGCGCLGLDGLRGRRRAKAAEVTA
jgi:uncharacterized membrane protein YphA (DoxX/SURF4 family)